MEGKQSRALEGFLPCANYKDARDGVVVTAEE